MPTNENKIVDRLSFVAPGFDATWLISRGRLFYDLAPAQEATLDGVMAIAPCGDQCPRFVEFRKAPRPLSPGRAVLKVLLCASFREGEMRNVA
jgi:hypothetical protein